MLHPLEQKIVVLQRRVRRSAAVYGLSLAGAVVVVAATVAGVADYVARFEDRGLRIVASLAALAVSLWAAYRFLRPALFTRPSDVDLAGRVERHFPSLQNQLQSAIEFLRQPEDDPAAGSAALRRLAIAQATASAEGIEFDDVLNNRPRNRALGIFVASCVLLAGLAAIGPTSARIAAARFLNPLGDTAWPRATNLAVRGATERVARGSAFQIEVVDRYGARLPADLRIHYRQRADGGITEDNERMRFADGVMVARRENVQQSFEYRIDGGDDRSMPWSGVEVVDPPAIESLSIRAIPPTYTGWPAADSPRQIRTLIGARLQSTGRATKPLRSAELCFEGGRKIAATLCEDGRSFFVGEADAVIEKSGSYWFELIDRDGFRGGNEDRCQINAIADAPPSVAMQQPTANVLVTPQAVVPLRVFAEDDIALRNVVLKFRTSDGGPEQTVTLWTAAGGASRSPSAADWAAGVEDRQTINYRWGLEGLRLKPGSEVTFCVAAGDYRPQSSCSEPRRLIVVTPDELLEKLSSREKLIAAELERALAMQRECRRQVESLRVRLLAATRFEQGDVDQLQAAEHAQQDVGRLITDRSNAVPAHIIALLADFENNRISSTDADRRMRGLLEELGRLEKGRLPVIGRELIAARKTVQTAREEHRAAADSGRRVADALTAGGGQQDAVIGALEQWVTQLARWDRYGRFQRELALLIREQDELTHRTVDAGRRTLAQDLHELGAMDAAELAVAAGG
ncbi:MAG: hypothetical protein LLG00_14325, partial [Planctomycetaceae bacterium]|nr:hypothetical protein [Planctomycetaceae bacterium]